VVPGASPVKVTECDVTSAELTVEEVPYPVVVPYSTCELDSWSVVQVIVADVVVIPLEATALMTGAVTGVAKVKFPEVTVPAESVDMTA
jgi:hypothetical protein